MNLARVIFVGLWIGLGFAAGVRAQTSPALFEIGARERVVHLIGAPFSDANREPRLEAMLLKDFAPHGLTYRRVAGDLAQLVGEIEDRIMVFRPTIVLIQTGNWDLVKQRHFDFSGYPRAVEQLVAELVRRRTRVILCSPVPVGGSQRGRLVFPTDGLARWTEAARQTAARHGAVFVDLFTDAIEWPMLSSNKGPYHYSTEEHRKSFDLFCRQVRFVPAASAGSKAIGRVRADSGKELDFAAFRKELARGEALAAALTGIKSFVLPEWAKVPDFAAQKEAALAAATRELESYDAQIAAMVGGK